MATSGTRSTIALRVSAKLTEHFRILKVFTRPSARASNSEVIKLASLTTTEILGSRLRARSLVCPCSLESEDVCPLSCSFSGRSLEAVSTRLLIKLLLLNTTGRHTFVVLITCFCEEDPFADGQICRSRRPLDYLCVD